MQFDFIEAGRYQARSDSRLRIRKEWNKTGSGWRIRLGGRVIGAGWYRSLGRAQEAAPEVYAAHLREIGETVTDPAQKAFEAARSNVPAPQLNGPASDRRATAYAEMGAAIDAAVQECLTIWQAQGGPSSVAEAVTDAVPAADMADLLAADDSLTTRIVRRAGYDALRAVEAALDDCLEGCRENQRARDLDLNPVGGLLNETDFRQLVLDEAADRLGVRDQWQRRNEA